MAVQIQQIERKFTYGQLSLDDPDPSMSLHEVKDFYAGLYPELNQSNIEEKETTETSITYEFLKAAGTKG